MKAIVRLEVQRTYHKTIFYYAEVEVEPKAGENPEWMAEGFAEEAYFNAKYDRAIDRQFADEMINDEDDELVSVSFDEFLDDEEE